jgi:hypothetical protein
VRNSSLVEWCGADNITGLRSSPKLWIASAIGGCSGRGAFHPAGLMPSLQRGRSFVKRAGAGGSANAGMSSVLWVRTPHTGSQRVPEQGRSAQGEAGLSRGSQNERRRWTTGGESCPTTARWPRKGLRPTEGPGGLAAAAFWQQPLKPVAREEPRLANPLWPG